MLTRDFFFLSADPTNTAPRKIKVVNADPCNSSAEASLDGTWLDIDITPN